MARARGYVQSGAVFYRDAGNADSYERAGPVGSFFTADQELAPLADLLARRPLRARQPLRADAAALAHVHRRRMGARPEYLKIFALSPEPPNAARIRGFASALVASVGATGRF